MRKWGCLVIICTEVTSAPEGGPYTDVNKTPLTKDKREYTDVTLHNNTYYQISTVDKSGNETSRSFPFLVQIEDNTPPAIPTGLTGLIKKDGIAELTWQPNKDNDLMGYRVFRSNSLKEEFVEITQKLLTKPSVVDSIKLKVLNRKIYYRVAAVDKNYNASEFSETLALTKPDIVPPIAPIFTKAEIENNSIILKWANSPSEDVAKVELTRIEKEDRVSRVIRTWTPPMVGTELNEASLAQGKSYQYKLTVYDSAGNISEGLSPALYFETGFRNAVSNIKATVDRDGRQINFQWKNNAPVTKCMIYRKKNDEPLILYQTLNGDVASFTDKHVSINNTYIYKVQVVYEKGIKSLLSEEIKVIY
jgi:uncharacterized protein